MKKGLIIGLLFTAISILGFASENDGIFEYRLGQFQVYMMVEAERDGNTAIIPAADEAVINRYIPADGFKHSTNAFLVKAPGQNILIDAGTGAGGILVDKMKKLGVEPEQIDTVLITHLHGDHFGSLQREGRAVFPNAKVYLSAREHEHFTRTQVNANAVAALVPYEVIRFEPSALGGALQELLPGISPIANYGHTPGHTLYLIENGGEKLLICGDFLHVALVQFPLPDISATFDMDQAAAAASRREIMDYAARNNVPIGGMHIVYPGIGTVEAEREGYRFIPVR